MCWRLEGRFWEDKGLVIVSYTTKAKFTSSYSNKFFGGTFIFRERAK